MEAQETVLRMGPALDDLAEVMSGPGPYLTIYLTTDGTVDNAAYRSEQRWKVLRRTLAEEGAPESSLALVDPLAEDAHHEGQTLAVVATSDELVLVEHLGEALDQDRGCWARLPDVVPLIRWRQSQPPYVLALADRGGADLVAERPGAPNLEMTEGDGHTLRKVNAGGWSQRRYQERAENDWADTATDVASQVARLADAVDARIIVLGGDIRATRLIQDELPVPIAGRVHLIEQGRAADGSDDERETEIRRLIATAVAEDTRAVVESFKQERGQHDRAVEGAAATVDALNRAAVDVLLVHDERDRTAMVGRSPVPIGLDRASAAIAGDDHVEQANLVDALVRAAIGTGASVRVVPGAGPVAEGIGAVLRWSDSAA